MMFVAACQIVSRRGIASVAAGPQIRAAANVPVDENATSSSCTDKMALSAFFADQIRLERIRG
jgi:hypothetical protein